MTPPLLRPALGRPIRLLERSDIPAAVDPEGGILELGLIVTLARRSSGVAGSAFPFSIGEDDSELVGR